MSNTYKFTKSFIFSIFTIIFLFLTIPAFSQQNNVEEYADEEYETISTKLLYFDIGYGEYKWSGALGFRYSFFGFDVGVTGFADTIPFHVQYYDDRIPANTNDYRVDKFINVAVSFNASFYYDFEDLSIFSDYDPISVYATLGYYIQSDSLLAWVYDKGRYLYPTRNEFKPIESSQGITYGLGAQYFFQNGVEAGIGYHSKNGIFFQLGFRWD